MTNQIRDRFPECCMAALDMFKPILPLPWYGHHLGKPTRGKFASFCFSDSGETCAGMTELLGGRLLEVTHLVPTWRPPGLTLVFLRFNGQLSALVYVPYNMVRNKQNAAVVYVHGGPASQTVNSFNRGIQYLANQGYMVIAPNYRGSTGFGKEFQQANFFDMGGHSLLAMKVVNRTGAAFHIRLPLVAIFDSPTIAEFSQVVKEYQQIKGEQRASAQSGRA